MDNTRKVRVNIVGSTVKIGEEKFLSNLKITVVFEEDNLSTENRIVKIVKPKRCKAYEKNQSQYTTLLCLAKNWRLDLATPQLEP